MRFSLLAAALAVVVLGACVTYDGRGLRPGLSSPDDVRSAMGEPTAVHRAAAGETWEYARGPEGPHTYMLRFGGDGALLAIDQVLSAPYFERIEVGMDGEQVRRILGTPQRVSHFARRDELVWDYLWSDGNHDYRRYFHVVFDPSGRVKSTLHTTEYPPSGPHSAR